ncbi:hypothetical protein SAMN04487886_100633 [Clostridium sp. DSM 8431]|uniref:hypothetical protein n=1 Tax=Clostridium sp. DSM 8431 TaxID=1761781 RepID=UPI0008E40F6E|nr:hypothetical protein [Clostridium sp. DSM 8431]SFU32028.1 hypothetical protein SAMN04487886_100633 [Clostridium sp. DSM 8431]
MIDLEKEIYIDIVNLYKEAERQISFRPVKYLEMINSGAKPSEVVKRLIFREGGSFEFEVLRKNNRLDLSIESIVINEKYSQVFSEDEKEWCKLRLKNLKEEY